MHLRTSPLAVFSCLLGLSVTLLPGCTSPPDLSPDGFEEVRDYAQTYVEWAAFDGVVLIAEGPEIVFLEGFGLADYETEAPVSPDTRFRLASLSKQFTNALLASQIRQGRLSVTSALEECLPDFNRASEISLQQLVDHTAGVPHTNRLEWMDMAEFYELDFIIAKLSETPLDFDPGTDSRYSNGGYAVLAACIEALEGKRFEDVVTSTFGADYPSIAQASAFEDLADEATRYAPGPSPGERVAAARYVAANRVGGGSLIGNATDVFRMFRSSFRGEGTTADVRDMLFSLPEDGDLLVTGRSPGALAQVYYDRNDDLTVVTLSSNSAWPARFAEDIRDLYRGVDLGIAPLVVATEWSPEVVGTYTSPTFGWTVAVDSRDTGLVWNQAGEPTAFVPLDSGAFYLPLWDWVCDLRDDGLLCRQRTPSQPNEFRFDRSEDAAQ